MNATYRSHWVSTKMSLAAPNAATDKGGQLSEGSSGVTNSSMRRVWSDVEDNVVRGHRPAMDDKARLPLSLTP
jgi:hypothetical protein